MSFSSWRMGIGVCCLFLSSCYGAGQDESLLRQSLLAERLSFDPLAKAAWLSVEYRKNSYDGDTVIAYSRALRAIGSSFRALEVTQESIERLDGDAFIMLEHGKNLLANGYYHDAASTLEKVHLRLGDRWEVLASLALAMDFLKRHKKAQELYTAALEQAPEDSVVLSNYALSLILSGQTARAEKMIENIRDPRYNRQAHNNLHMAKRWLARKEQKILDKDFSQEQKQHPPESLERADDRSSQ